MNLKNCKIGVLMGGYTGERDVSLSSGHNVYQALLNKGYDAHKVDISDPDVIIDKLVDNGTEIAFICLHGGIGEDGTIQTLLEILDIPYTGSPILASALAMDKVKSKKKFEVESIPTPNFLTCQSDPDNLYSHIESELDLPVVFKPVSKGSSLGIKFVNNKKEFLETYHEMENNYKEYFIEDYIPGKEITVGILRKDGEDLSLPLIELNTKTDFYDYEAKYTEGMTEFIIPAEVDNQTAESIRQTALEAHWALGCYGFSRVDFRVNPSDDFFVLEVNTVPGMTRTSDLPKAAESMGIKFDSLVEYMLKTVAEKVRKKREKSTE